MSEPYIEKGLVGARKRLAVQLNTPDGRSKPLKTETARFTLCCRQQPLYGRKHKIATTQRRLEETEETLESELNGL